MTLRGDPEYRTPCAEVGAPDLWFAKERSKRRLAVSVCRACPAQDRCLAEALRLHPIRGIWAGTTLADRERILLLAATEEEPIPLTRLPPSPPGNAVNSPPPAGEDGREEETLADIVG